MASLLCGGVGVLVKSLAGLSRIQATRCSSLLGALSALQHSTTRWFSKRQPQEGLPKPPLTSFIRFAVEQRPVLAKQFPESKMTEVSKMLGLEWRGLSESAKKPYIEAASEDRVKYLEEVKKYKEKLSPLELQMMKDKRKWRQLKRNHIRHRREMTVLGKPKGTRTAYNIFMSEHFQDAKDTSSLRKMQFLQDEWKKLPASQKQMYVQLAQDDRIRYENEMKAWEEQMFEIGREDLVRGVVKKQLLKASKSMHEAKSKNRIKTITKPGRGGKTADYRKNEE